EVRLRRLSLRGIRGEDVPQQVHVAVGHPDRVIRPGQLQCHRCAPASGSAAVSTVPHSRPKRNLPGSVLREGKRFLSHGSMLGRVPADPKPLGSTGPPAATWYPLRKTLPHPLECSMPRLRYALAGAGHRAQMYVDAIVGAHRERAELVAICEPNPARARLHAETVAAAGERAPRIGGPED